MNHLISDMGGEFEGELGEFWETYGLRQYFTASEAPRQNGLVERQLRNLEGGCQEGNQRCRGSRFRGNAKTRLHGELGKERPHQRLLDTRLPNGSRIQVAVVASG